MLEKTIFTSEYASAKMLELIDWLQANATDYFTNFAYNPDDENQFICTTSGGSKVIFSKSGCNSGIIMANESSYYSGEYSDRPFTYAVKTNNGIYLHRNGNDEQFGGMIISKSNADDIVISFREWKYLYRLIVPDKNIIYSYENVNNYLPSDATSFAYIPTGNGTYTENLLFTPFTQYVGIPCILTDSDGQKYVYDGFCALKYEE